MIDSKRPCPVPGYQVELLDGELILFHPASMTMMHSNRSGVLIWNLCDGERTVADIVALLSAAYPDSAADIRADIEDMLQTLVKHGAIEWR